MVLISEQRLLLRQVVLPGQGRPAVLQHPAGLGGIVGEQVDGHHRQGLGRRQVAGIGVGEVTLSYVLIQAGATSHAAAGVALLTLVIGLILPGVIGLFVTLSSSDRDRGSKVHSRPLRRLEPSPVRVESRELRMQGEVAEE